METNNWDNIYFTLITEMLNRASNIADTEETPSYRYFEMRFHYNLNLGFPISTCRKVEFSQIKEQVEALINSLNKDDVNTLCDTLLNNEVAITEFKLANNYIIYFEKVRNNLTMIVNEIDTNITNIPEEVAKLALFLMIVGRTVALKNLALQIGCIFCRMKQEDIDGLVSLVNKETFEAPTVSLKKQTSLYDYASSYATLKDYKYSE